MTHDNEYIVRALITGLSSRRMMFNAVRDYHEHMMKWRPISEPPEHGEWVEVLCNQMGDIHSITYGPAEFHPTDLGWRPAMPLNIGES